MDGTIGSMNEPELDLERTSTGPGRAAQGAVSTFSSEFGDLIQLPAAPIAPPKPSPALKPLSLRPSALAKADPPSAGSRGPDLSEGSFHETPCLSPDLPPTFSDRRHTRTHVRGKVPLPQLRASIRPAEEVDRSRMGSHPRPQAVRAVPLMFAGGVFFLFLAASPFVAWLAWTQGPGELTAPPKAHPDEIMGIPVHRSLRRGEPPP